MVHSPAPSPGTLSFPPLDPRQAPARLPSPPIVEGETGGVKGRDRTGHSPAWQNGHFTSGPYRPACCGVTLAQPQCHWRHDTKTLCHSEVQRCVCSWQDPALATPSLPPTARSGAGRGPKDPGPSSVPSQAWACRRLFGYGLCVFPGRAGRRLDAQKRGLPLVTFSLLPDRVATGSGPGGARCP